MKHIFLILLAGLLSLSTNAEEPAALNAENTDRWSKKEANAWYAKQQWPCGFNYIPANAISYTEMWMPYCFNPELIDKELVNGKTQTHLAWGWRPGQGEPEVWQHDLYTTDHAIYDENELELFRKYIGLSKKR